MNDIMKRFLRQLGFWTIHGTLLVLPSFLIAGLLLGFFDSPAKIAAMLAGTLPFLFGFAALTTFAKPFQDPHHLLPRALRLALLLRIACVLLFGLFSLGAPGFLWAIPDIWAGLGAAFAAGWVGDQLGHGNLLDSSSVSPHLVFFCTVLEGIILSFFISLLTFFCLLSSIGKRANVGKGLFLKPGRWKNFWSLPRPLPLPTRQPRRPAPAPPTPRLRDSNPSHQDDKPLQPRGQSLLEYLTCGSSQ